MTQNKMQNTKQNFILSLYSRISGFSPAKYLLITVVLLVVFLLGGTRAFAYTQLDTIVQAGNICCGGSSSVFYIKTTPVGLDVITTNSGAGNYLTGHLTWYYGVVGDTSTPVHDTDYTGTHVSAAEWQAIAGAGFYDAFTSTAGDYWIRYYVDGGAYAGDYAVPFNRAGGGAVTGMTAPTCSDGIENGDETGVDVGGSCAVMEITTPADTTTLENFDKWQVHVSHVDDTDSLSSIVVFYSDDSAKLTECDEFPYGAHGYTDCFYDTTRIFYDESPQFSGGIYAGDHTYPILKAETLITGKTYYAKAYLRSPNLSGAVSNVITSSTISFTIGIPTVVSPAPTSCATFDIACYLKIALTWAFIPSTTSIEQFSGLVNFTTPEDSLLATKLPFSYGFDIPVMWNELFDTSASGTLGISVPLLGGGTGDLLSATTISANSWYGGIVRPFISVGLYLMAFWIIYKKVFGIHDASHKTV